MALSPADKKVRDRVVVACVALAKEISREGADPKTGPRTLYHYTGAPGLIGILEGSALWLSRASALNDPSEVSYGWGVVNDFVKKRFDEFVTARVASPQAFFYGFVRDELENDRPRTKKLDPFVACFCEKPDLLSQWVYYAQDGGYSIGFRRDRLISAEQASLPEDPAKPAGKKRPPKAAAPDEAPFELCPVVYRPVEQRRLVADAGRRFEELLAEEVSRESKYHHDRGARAAAKCFVVAMGTLVCRMKAEGFKTEREWRLITFPKEGPMLSPGDADGLEDARRMKFRDLRGRIIPYFEALYGRGKAPIVSVRSGPTIDFRLAADSIQRLLKGRGYPWRKIKVLASTVSLRQ